MLRTYSTSFMCACVHYKLCELRMRRLFYRRLVCRHVGGFGWWRAAAGLAAVVAVGLDAAVLVVF